MLLHTAPWYCPVAGSVWSELWPRLSHDTWLNQYPIITITSPSPPQVSDLSLLIGGLCHSSAPIGQHSDAHQPCPITSISSIRTSQHQSHLHCPLIQLNQCRFCPKNYLFNKSRSSWKIMFKIKEDFHFWRMDVERREIGNGYVNVGHGTKVILSVSSLSLSGGQELTITTDVFSFPCYQFPFVFTHINKWIQKHTTPFFPHIISALWTSVDISNKICFTVSVELKYSHKASLCPHYGVRTLGRWGPWTMDMTMAQHNDQRTRERLPWDNTDTNNAMWLSI